MKAILLIRKSLILFSMAGLGFLVSCTEENVALQDEAALITEDVLTDYYFEDTDDLASLAMLADFGNTTGGRQSGGPSTLNIQDARLNCPGVQVTFTLHPESTLEIPKGEIVIDFGSGCIDQNGNERKGKIIIRFNGRKFQPGSVIVTRFEQYSINGIALMGIRTMTNVTGSMTIAPRFSVQLVNGKTIWPDGSEATREHCFLREWIRNGTNPSMEAMVVGQCASEEFAAKGINRRGKAYSMKIIEPLIYKRGCPIAVKGIKQFIDDSGKVILVNYGDGTCDRIITITSNGNTRKVDLKKRS
jgi:uncharacterized Zn-finger protein